MQGDAPNQCHRQRHNSFRRPLYPSFCSLQAVSWLKLHPAARDDPMIPSADKRTPPHRAEGFRQDQSIQYIVFNISSVASVPIAVTVMEAT